MVQDILYPQFDLILQCSGQRVCNIIHCAKLTCEQQPSFVGQNLCSIFVRARTKVDLVCLIFKIGACVQDSKLRPVIVRLLVLRVPKDSPKFGNLPECGTITIFFVQEGV